MPRASTILVLLDTAVLRADVKWRRGRARIEEIRRSERGRREAAEVIDQLAIGAPLRGAVLVLSDEVFLQTIEVAPKAIAGLDAKALTAAIAFEAQTFSGLDVEAVTDWWRRGDEREFLVAQLGATDVAAIADAVDRAGGTLAGIAHPAGVPSSLRSDVAFVRREEWGTVRAVVRGTGIAERVYVSRGRAADEETATVTEQLVVSGAVPPIAGAARFDLTDDEAAGAWLESWVESIRTNAPLAMIVPPEAPSVRQRRFVYAAIALVAVVGAGVVDRSHVQSEVLAASTDLAAARAPLERLRAAEAEVDALTHQLAELKKVQPVSGPEAAVWSTSTLMAMLDALAEHRPPGVILDELALGWRRCVIRGRTADPVRVDRWTSALAPAVGKCGYSVVPGNRQRQPADQGGLFAFQFELQAAGAASAAAVTEETR